MDRRAVLLLSLCLVSACGGKIMPGTEIDPGGGIGSGAAQPAEGSAQSQPAEPATPSDVNDPVTACRMVCDRNGSCGDDRYGCEDDCVADLRGACASQTAAYVTCFASRLEDRECASLPPACEQAWCAWAACKGQPLVSYCG